MQPNSDPMKNQNFLTNRRRATGYAVTIHTPGYMGMENHRTKQAAIESAQSHALKGASATVTPQRTSTFIFNGQRVTSVRYFLDTYGWQFVTTLQDNAV
jgi:hypothetical protein